MKTTTTEKPASITYGTSHFESLNAARRYYRAYLGEPVFTSGDLSPRTTKREKDEENDRIVSTKLASGEIHIGPPALKPGQKLSLHREERRYFITG